MNRPHFSPRVTFFECCNQVAEACQTGDVVRRCIGRGRWSIFALVLLLVLAVVTATLAQEKEPSKKGKTGSSDVLTGDALPGLEHIDSAMLKTLKENRLVGAGVAIAKDGRLVLSRGYGYADVEARTPVQPTSVFALASCSKPFYQAAIFQLVNEKKLDLDDKLLRVVPQLRSPRDDPRLEAITIRHLLQHRSGLPRDAAVAKDPKDTPLPFFRRCLEAPLEADPGTTGIYSNLGYAILGVVVRQAAGESSEQYTKEHMLKKMGIKTMRQRGPGHTTNEVHYYDSGKKLKDDPGLPPAWDSEWRATPVDVVRFLIAADGSGGKPPLFPESLMKEWHPNPNWSKTGSLPGSNTLMVHNHKDGLDWTILLNSSHRAEKEKEDKDKHPTAYEMIGRAIRETTRWPEGDLFEKYR